MCRQFPRSTGAKAAPAAAFLETGATVRKGGASGGKGGAATPPPEVGRCLVLVCLFVNSQ